jgi:hypothetical protein
MIFDVARQKTLTHQLKSICCANSNYDYFRFIRVLFVVTVKSGDCPSIRKIFSFDIWAILGRVGISVCFALTNRTQWSCRNSVGIIKNSFL